MGHLEPLKKAENATLPLELLTREKSDVRQTRWASPCLPLSLGGATLCSLSLRCLPQGNAANYAALVTALKSSHAGAVVSTLLKEKPLGEFSESWRKALVASELTQVELAPSLADLLAPKDAIEAKFTKWAGVFSSQVMTKFCARLTRAHTGPHEPARARTGSHEHDPEPHLRLHAHLRERD